MKKILILIVSSLMIFGLVGCDNAKTPATDGKTPATEGTKNIYFITKILGNQYWSVVEQGGRDAAAELGVNITVVGVASEADVEKQVQLLQDGVASGADAIIIGPVDSTAMANPVSDAYKSGIPIICVDTKINTEDFSAAFLTNNLQAGKDAGEEMIKRLKDAGVSEDEEIVIAIQVGNSGSQTIIDRLEGFNAYWDANAPANWKVLNDDVKVNDGDITKAVGFTQDFITTYPNLRGVFGPNNGSTVGFVTGLKEAGRTDIAMVGFDFSEEIADMIKGGEYSVSTVVQRQYFMGYEGVKLGVALANGGSVTSKEIDTGVAVVTSENINTPEIQEIVNPK